jgi:selenocysteine lyase/cysteine desulfurase
VSDVFDDNVNAASATSALPRLSLKDFRSRFAALHKVAWLDTPGCPPAAQPVLAAVRDALTAWEAGDFSWVKWDETPDAARSELAELLRVGAKDIGLVTSLSEAASTVARSLPRGSRVLVSAEEFRSNLFPWTALAERGDLQVVSPPAGDPASLTERLCASLVEGIDLIAVSTAVSSTGCRPDLAAIGARARSVGARTFINATQSFGVIRLDLAVLQPDFLAVHGYKWMLAPRGCAWLYVRPDRLEDVRPLAPGWHTVVAPNADYFGSTQQWSPDARKLDGALPWLPWIGGRAALRLLSQLDPEQVQTRAIGLAREARQGLEALGIQLAGSDQDSHIVRMYAPGCDELVRHLRERGVMTSGSPTGLRIGFHGFNDNSDLVRFLQGVESWQARRTEH